MAGHVALFQLLHAADAVLDASLPHTLKEHRSRERPKLLTSGVHGNTRAARGCYRQGPEEWRDRVRERLVPSRKTGPVHINPVEYLKVVVLLTVT